jgi:hypothetical protein
MKTKNTSEQFPIDKKKLTDVIDALRNNLKHVEADSLQFIPGTNICIFCNKPDISGSAGHRCWAPPPPPVEPPGPKAAIIIESCSKCPHKESTNFWSSDGWDRMEDWICKLSNNKKIAGAVEWHEERKIKIPNWCPILKE